MVKIMENKINLEIKQFTDKLVDIINNNSLPIEVKKLVLFMIYMETQSVANNEIAKETMLVENKTLPSETKTYTLDLKEGENKCVEE
jgi:hypothetical protein